MRLGTNAQGQATVNSYVLLSLLGSGSYGRVYLCRDWEGRHFAIKIVDKVKLRKKRLGRDDAEQPGQARQARLIRVGRAGLTRPARPARRRGAADHDVHLPRRGVRM